ncbi:MAG: SusD/RagB family nutrient-binding outer membrane lipoprotein [Muribaculaceae bacterium]|nr:SusD/RagB family nutrient-binding outer membrane lipoprotein [Muribaculaceae bacterium]
MKKVKFYIFSLVALLALGSCSDKYMSDLNTDPSKAASIDPNAQLTTAVLQTYGDLGLVEIFRDYHYAFTQHFMGCWNTTNYGGLHVKSDNEMCRIWTNFYPTALKNLTDAIVNTTDDETKVNINAALRIYRAYMISLVTDTYGDAPCSEMGLGYISEKYTPKYDTQESIYDFIFDELKACQAAFNLAGDDVTGDLIYGGDVMKWRRLANSLRMRFAMRISNVAPEKAKTEFEAAVSDGVFMGASDDALIKYMDVAFSFGQDSYSDYRGNALSQLWFGNDPANNPTFLCSTFFNTMKDSGDPRTYRIARFYFDDLMSGTAPTGRYDLTDEIISKGVKMNPCDPGCYWWEPWPEGYTSDIVVALQEKHPELDPYCDKETRPKLANNFLKGSNPGVVMTYAEVNFLMAEAALLGWNVPGSAEDFYKTGVRASMDFLVDNYGVDPITNDEFDTFMTNYGFGYTKEEQLNKINTQAWILHFTNPYEAWSNQRRSDFPRLKSPAEFVPLSIPEAEYNIPVRLEYPSLEASYNKTSYEEAKARIGGSYSWHTPVWWDVPRQ